MKTLWYAVPVTLVVAGIGASLSATAAPFYEGKTITFINPTGPSSASTLHARTHARFMSKYIPGNPKIVVKNMPGGQAVKGINFVYEKAKRNGLTMLYGPWSVIGWAVGSPGLRADFTKVNVIGGHAVQKIAYIRHEVIDGGFKKNDDIMKAKKFRLGATRPSGNFSIPGRAALDLLGIPYVFVTGYRGNGAVTIAALRGEVKMALNTTTGYYAHTIPQMVKPGKAFPLWYYPFLDANGNPKAQNDFPGVESFVDFYARIKGKKPSGPKWDVLAWHTKANGQFGHLLWLPPGSSKEAVDALATGWKGVIKDPELLKLYREKFGGTMAYATGDDAPALVSTLKNTSPEVRATLKQMVNQASDKAPKAKGKRKKK